MGNYIESFTVDTYGITWYIDIYEDGDWRSGNVGVLVTPVLGGQRMDEWTETVWGVPYTERYQRYAERVPKLIDACMHKIKELVPELRNMINVVMRYPST